MKIRLGVWAALLVAFACGAADAGYKQVEAFDTRFTVPESAEEVPDSGPALVHFRDHLSGMSWMVERRMSDSSEAPATLEVMVQAAARGMGVEKLSKTREVTVDDVEALACGGDTDKGHFEFSVCFRAKGIYLIGVYGEKISDRVLRREAESLWKSLKFTSAKPAVAPLPKVTLADFGLKTTLIADADWKARLEGEKAVGVEHSNMIEGWGVVVMRREGEAPPVEFMDEDFARKGLGFQSATTLEKSTLKVDGLDAAQFYAVFPARSGGNTHAVSVVVPKWPHVYLIMVVGPDKSQLQTKAFAEKFLPDLKWVD